MTFEAWWMSDENRWSDTRYTKKVAEMAWYAALADEPPPLTADELADKIAERVLAKLALPVEQDDFPN